MANQSIYNAFERMWTHVLAKIGGKADLEHTHDEYFTEVEMDAALENINKDNIGLGNVDNTSDTNKPVSTAQQVAIDSALSEAKKYADDKDALLLNNSSAAVDSIMELATAMSENEDVVDALESAIGNKVDKVSGKGLSTNDLTATLKSNYDAAYSHVSNKSNPHEVTLSQLGVNATATELNYVDGVTSGIQTQLDEKASSGHTHIYYGVCSTAADTVAKTVTIPDFKLETGAMVIVKFTNANNASNPTLNVSGTGAKPMYRYGTTAISTGTTSTGWYANSVQVFVYDGTGWIRDYWNNTTYSNASLGSGYATCSTAASTVAKTVTLSSYSLTTGGIVAVKFTNTVPAGATLNINSKGAKSIYYRGAAITANIINAGDIATFVYSTNYHLISIDRWQDDIEGIIEVLGEKQATISGGASTITSSNLTADRALISNGSGKVAVSAVTSTELGYLDGVTSNIQTQLDGKASSSHRHDRLYKEGNEIVFLGVDEDGYYFRPYSETDIVNLGSKINYWNNVYCHSVGANGYPIEKIFTLDAQIEEISAVDIQTASILTDDIIVRTGAGALYFTDENSDVIASLSDTGEFTANKITGVNKLYHSDGTDAVTVTSSDSGYFLRPTDSSSNPVTLGSTTHPWKSFVTNRAQINEYFEVQKAKPIFTYLGTTDGTGLNTVGSTVSYATNMYVGSSGIVSKTTNTSSRTIKHDIKDLENEDIKAENLYRLPVYQAKYNDDIIGEDDARYLKDLPMFIIEEMDEVYPIAIDKPSENVKEWSWNSQYLIPPMLKLIQEQKKEIDELKERVELLENK